MSKFLYLTKKVVSKRELFLTLIWENLRSFDRDFFNKILHKKDLDIKEDCGFGTELG